MSHTFLAGRGLSTQPTCDVAPSPRNPVPRCLDRDAHPGRAFSTRQSTSLTPGWRRTRSIPHIAGGKYDAQQVTDVLRQRIALGQYAVGDRPPSIEQLNDEFFSVDAGPKPARDAYAPLIQEGMVTARVGRAGGHFLVSAEPLPTLQFLQEVATSLTDVVGANREVYVVEFRKARSRHGFGECFLPSRLAAESFAVAVLQAMGEPRLKAKRAAAAASESPALTQRGGYHFRIYGRRLGQLREATPDSASGAEIN